MLLAAHQTRCRDANFPELNDGMQSWLKLTYNRINMITESHMIVKTHPLKFDRRI